jgi:carboxylesterase
MEKNRTGCLVIHGFGGGIHEIETLADHLKEEGYQVACPRLKGHTGNRVHMKKATYQDWIASAETELIRLRQKTDDIVLVGFSMGGLIAVNLACKYRVRAIVTINTPIYYWELKRVAQNIAEDVKYKKSEHIRRYLSAQKASPMVSMLNFLKLLNITKTKLNKINVPFFAIQAKDDDTVKIKSASYIMDNISSQIKQVKYYNKGGHLILKSDTAPEVIADVEEFIDSLYLKEN